MTNRLITIGFSLFIAILVGLPSLAGEPGNNGPTLDFSAVGAMGPAAAAEVPNYDPIGAITPFVAFGGGGANAPAGHMGIGARIALSHEAVITLGYALAPSSADEFAPAHSLMLGFSFKF